MDNKQTLSGKDLTYFFRQLRPALLISHTREPAIAIRLAHFFDLLRQELPLDFNKGNETKTKPVSINIETLKCFFRNINQPLDNARRAAFGFNPLTLFNLNRNEVANSTLLAWLLNPLENHGFSTIFVDAVLGKISRDKWSEKQPSILKVTSSCKVNVEQCPLGEQSERFDIEIDDAQFYIVIEVKIDAPEGNEQLKRYAESAKIRAGNRPWCIIFLTPQGQLPKTAGGYISNVHAISWKNISSLLTEVLRKHRVFEHKRLTEQQKHFSPEKTTAIFLAKSFLTHCKQF